MEKKIYNGYIVITFNLYNLPKVIDVEWYKVKVRTYFPNPMRCRNCQLLGHIKNKCSNQPSCDGCNLPLHPETNCKRLKCANCGDKHPSSDKNCPLYIQQKEIIKIKTIDKCSFGIAKSKYEMNARLNPQQKTSQSYSEALKSQNTEIELNKQKTKGSAASPKKTSANEKLPRGTHPPDQHLV